MSDKVRKTTAEWQKELSPEEYYICREKGTERPFQNAYWDNKDAGHYACKCCGAALFLSETKFDSGTGWPSFYAPVNPQAVSHSSDNSHFMTRVEALCSVCDAHLGHVFDDGPKPSGQRYCINSSSLDFKKKALGNYP